MTQMERPESNMTGASVRITVVIATIRRPEIVSQTIARIISGQTFKPHELIISTVSREDAGEAAELPGVTTVIAPPGLAAQRNAALNKIGLDADVIVFFDDDFVPNSRWLEIVAHVFQSHLDVVGVTGDVIADGIKGPGFSFEEADKLLHESGRPMSLRLIDGYSPYGCNMAFKRSAVGDLRFDERLVLYGWLEDRDFGARLSRKGGRLVKCMQARGVHLGVKSGRIAGQRLGYSQIINPVYLFRKRTMTASGAVGQIFRNVASNVVGAIIPEPYIDRRGRLKGNLLGIYDAICGKIEPERAQTVI